MPELPEVEVVRRGLERGVAGRTVADVRVTRDRAVRRHLAEDRTSAVRHVRTTRSPDRQETTAVFAVDGAGTWAVRVRTVHREERLLTCRAPSAACGTGQQVVDLVAL